MRDPGTHALGLAVTFALLQIGGCGKCYRQSHLRSAVGHHRADRTRSPLRKPRKVLTQVKADTQAARRPVQMRRRDNADAGIRRRDAAPMNEARLRFLDGGTHEGVACTCTRDCPSVCDGACGCEPCTRTWFDAGLDVII